LASLQGATIVVLEWKKDLCAMAPTWPTKTLFQELNGFDGKKNSQWR
jgi:hypothetical protein